MKHLILRALPVFFAFMAAISAVAQNELVVSQYMHNYFAVNPSFAGCGEGLSLFGSARRQWATIESTPLSGLLTVNTPMRHEKLTAGLSLYYQSLHQTTNAGVLATVGYRTQVSSEAWLGFALQPGAAFRSYNWAKVSTIDPDDDSFAENETGIAPLLGFGVSFYGNRFFAGLSTSSFFVTNDFERKDTKFAPADATYIACGGYWFQLGKDFALQPSALVNYRKGEDIDASGSVSGIWREKVWLSVAYRTTKEATFGLAFKPNIRWKVAYNYSMDMGPLKSYSGGSHEISLQYDFIYKIKAVGPRFY